MGLIDRLKNVGQRASSVAHEGIAKVRSKFEDAEGRLRQRMRVYPKRPKLWGTPAGEMGMPADGEHIDEQMDDEATVPLPIEKVPDARPSRRAPIVSVHGKDIDEKDLDRGAA